MKGIFVFLVTVSFGTVATAQAVTFEKEATLARETLASIQPTSIAENVEFCGIIGLNRAGQLVASRPTRGEAGFCDTYTPSNIVVETASYHTHGAYSPDFLSELPSIEDIEGDVADGIDGYIATPGGRLWYHDTDAEEIFLLCGLGCLPSDPNFLRGSDGTIHGSYSHKELRRRLQN